MLRLGRLITGAIGRSVGGSAAPTAAPGRGGAAQLLFRQYADKAASAAAPKVHSPGKVIGLTALGAATVSGIYLAGTKHDNFSKEECERLMMPFVPFRDNYEGENEIVAHLKRAADQLIWVKETWVAPKQEGMLLPDLMDPPYRYRRDPTAKPEQGGVSVNDYTLVLGWEGVLVHQEHTMQYGFRTKKRPGVDYFLAWAKDHFAEVVLFAEGDWMEVQGAVEKLDPTINVDGTQNMDKKFMYMLSKNNMSFDEDGVTKFKDASRLNRDKKHLILLDAFCEEHYPKDLDNALKIPAFTGEDNDVALMDVIPLLQGILNVKADARMAIKEWNKYENPGASFVKKLKESRGDSEVAPRPPPPQQQHVAAPVGGAGGARDPATTAFAGTAPPAAKSEHWEVLGIRIW